MSRGYIVFSETGTKTAREVTMTLAHESEGVHFYTFTIEDAKETAQELLDTIARAEEKIAVSKKEVSGAAGEDLLAG